MFIKDSPLGVNEELSAGGVPYWQLDYCNGGNTQKAVEGKKQQQQKQQQQIWQFRQPREKMLDFSWAKERGAHS